MTWPHDKVTQNREQCHFCGNTGLLTVNDCNLQVERNSSELGPPSCDWQRRARDSMRGSRQRATIQSGREPHVADCRAVVDGCRSILALIPCI